MKYGDQRQRETPVMKSFGKRKASKITLKRHRKHRLLPREEEKQLPGNVAGLKAEDVINRQQG